jgi:hypothetical protein
MMSVERAARRRGPRLVVAKLVTTAALIAFALCRDARADLRAQHAVSFGPVLSMLVGDRPAGAHVARGSRRAERAVSTRAPISRGEPPGPGYCWYYINQSTGTPGFWDLCRGR